MGLNLCRKLTTRFPPEAYVNFILGLIATTLMLTLSLEIRVLMKTNVKQVPP